MKTKIILILLILTLSLLAWRLFVDNFSQEPTEIVIENAEDTKTEETIPEKVIDEIIKKDFDPDAEPASSPTEMTKNNSSPDENTQTDPPFIETTNNNDEEPDKIDNSFIINKKVSWGYSVSNNRNIDTLVIHSSYDALGSEPYDVDGLIKEYQQYSVAPHFLIDRKGNVYRLVDEKNIAYHAGVSKMPDGRTGVNNFSIGIELMNTKEDKYTSAQYSSLNKLIKHLEGNYSIKYILGHQDISPDRKTDPWNFDWGKVESKKSIHD